MKCEDVNARLIELVYGELDAATANLCRTHASECAACGAELAALGQTQEVLDAMPARETRIDLARLCLKTAQRQHEFRTKAIWMGAGAAAALLLAAGLLAATVQVETGPGQVVLAWRAAREEPPDGRNARPDVLPPDALPAPPPNPVHGMDERLAESRPPTPTTAVDRYARFGRAWSQAPDYLATRDRALALGLDSLQYTTMAAAAPPDQTATPTSYHELRRQLLDRNDRAPPKM